jgi:hypothetical protein
MTLITLLTARRFQLTPTREGSICVRTRSLTRIGLY